ncbi:Calcineurin-like phosphoesterase [Tangfeifania diversioriginum]|uniref:Calcineurin-like phosphoesterase n=1 Tax=Tangfeifania diversioriginum TaxID=1168035 RepID=A0A1M6K8T9_9BACT|nr:metallophosphoesterase family protein [Tangfeifania diversioriginum]SHJ55376.1 Calcineurin-like phosphoesterase [Tangfeifania diversioriginum]
MKTKYLILFFVLNILIQSAQSKNKTTLEFNERGNFKIAQFTDIHFKPGAPESEPSLGLIKYILETEQPDLVAFTGDIVTGRPAADGWKTVLEPVLKAGVPFAVTLGNHDDEHDLSRQQIRELLKSFPGYVGKKPDAASDFGDYLVKVNAENKEENALLYFLDSNAYSTLDSVEGYGWFSFDQVNWYRKQSRKNALKNGEKLPALAYFHIPLPEYQTAYDSEAKKKGQRNEDECSPDINTGMFTAMLFEGDVMGTFVGHDHVNDYIVNHYDIALAYGRWSGGKTTYGDLQHGSRIVVLEKGKRQFKTWMRLRDGQVVDNVLFPDDIK